MASNDGFLTDPVFLNGIIVCLPNLKKLTISLYYAYTVIDLLNHLDNIEHLMIKYAPNVEISLDLLKYISDGECTNKMFKKISVINM